MKHITFLLALLVGLFANAQDKDKAMSKLIDENLQFAKSQYLLLAKNTPSDLMPRSFKDGKLITSNTSWWTSGFFPGTLWYIYEYTKDTAIKSEAERRLKILEREKYHSSDHDLGFMIYNSFGNAYRITKKPEYRKVVLTAATTLAYRYRPSIRSIQSWDSSGKFKCPVIVDNMMNLELLCWASNELRDPAFAAIAIDHANTTLKNHYRPDHSSYHVVDYDLATGTVIKKITAQGFSDESAWSRGQSWGLYGFTMMYFKTLDPKFLQNARDIAQFLLHHPKLPSDKIPYWDYDSKDIPKTYRDVSAASIMASALLQLSAVSEGKEKDEYIAVAKKILQSLSSKAYRNKAGEDAGFLLKHSVGSLPQNSEVDVPLTYADYYFIEALLRYKEWIIEGKLPSLKQDRGRSIIQSENQ